MINGHGDDTFLYKDIRVNFSSNIFGHADMSALKQYLCQHINAIDSYPEPDAQSLASAIARKHGVEKECVMVTNGATDAIYLIAQTLSQSNFTHYYVKQPTFSEYEDACLMYGLKPTLQAHASCAGWICNPNNPTGAFTDIDYLPPFGAVVLDQSYEDFTTTQLLSPREAIKKGNVWQIHSLTKVYAVPGLRIGYIVSAPENIQALRRHIRPWSVNALAILAGKWLIEHEDAKAVRDIRDMLAETQRFQENLNKIPSIQAFRTCTHFFLARIHGHKAAELKDYLAREHHLLIRDASNFNGLDAHFFRISTQLPKENDLLLQAILQFVEKDY